MPPKICVMTTAAGPCRTVTAAGRRLVGLCSFGAVAVLAGNAAAAETSHGAQLATACAACHSMNGANAGIPVIAGMDEQATIGAMLDYKESETPSHVMHAVALSLSDEELVTVARYLAGHGRDPR